MNETQRPLKTRGGSPLLPLKKPCGRLEAVNVYQKNADCSSAFMSQNPSQKKSIPLPPNYTRANYVSDRWPNPRVVCRPVCPPPRPLSTTPGSFDPRIPSLGSSGQPPHRSPSKPPGCVTAEALPIDMRHRSATLRSPQCPKQGFHLIRR